MLNCSRLCYTYSTSNHAVRWTWPEGGQKQQQKEMFKHGCILSLHYDKRNVESYGAREYKLTARGDR